MKNPKTILVLLLFCTFGLLATTILDVMALHDIANDYVSQKALTGNQVTLSGTLPDWVSCSLEWGAIHVSIVLQFVLTILVIIGLIRIARKS